jgi:hypothetical protein
MNNDLIEFMKVVEGLVESSKELASAARLCDNDPIKQEMVAFLKPKFEEMWARTEGITSLVNGNNQNYMENKEFILKEIKEVTNQNLEIARKIREKLQGLLLN